MAVDCSVMCGLSWTEVCVLGSQVFGQALMDSCVLSPALIPASAGHLGNPV